MIVFLVRRCVGCFLVNNKAKKLTVFSSGLEPQPAPPLGKGSPLANALLPNNVVAYFSADHIQNYYYHRNSQ